MAKTLPLLSTLTLAAWWSSSGAVATEPGRNRDDASPGRARAAVAAAVAGMLMLGVSGAITALGDTLFPVSTIAEGKALTFSPSAHAFGRLRIWHPTLALAVGALLAWAVASVLGSRPAPAVRRVALAAAAIFASQFVLGVANVWWLAPIPLQIAHLLLADLAWIALVAMAASTFAATGSPSAG